MKSKSSEPKSTHTLLTRCTLKVAKNNRKTEKQREKRITGEVRSKMKALIEVKKFFCFFFLIRRRSHHENIAFWNISRNETSHQYIGRNLFKFYKETEGNTGAVGAALTHFS